MLKWLLNSEYYHIDKYLNNSNENFVRSSKYSINGEIIIINFSDLYNNYKYVHQVFWNIDFLLK